MGPVRIVHMFDYVDVSGLDAGAALGVVEQAQVLKRRAEVQEALAILRVVHAYRHQVPTDKVRLGGEGTGLVDDFACLELAAALHRSVDSVTPQVIELVNLEVRLPRLWEITIACGVPVWLARRIARVTGDLSLRQRLVGGCHDRPVRHTAGSGTAVEVRGGLGGAGRSGSRRSPLDGPQLGQG